MSSIEMKAYSYPTYLEPHTNFVAKTRFVRTLFNSLCDIGKELGADIECVPNKPLCKMVFWKIPEHAVVMITIFKTQEQTDTDNLIVEIQLRAGDRYLFRDTYANIVNIAINQRLVDLPMVNTPRPLSMPQILDEVHIFQECELNDIFDMVECEFIETRITGGRVLLQLYKKCRESEKTVIKLHPRLFRNINILLGQVAPSTSPDVQCATIGIILAIETGTKIEIDIIFEQQGIMWKEAQRQALRLLEILCNN
jgi:hypothetical protein